MNHQDKVTSTEKYDSLKVDKTYPIRYLPRVSSKSGQIIGIEEFLEWNENDQGRLDISFNNALTSSDLAQLWRSRLTQLQRNFAFLKQHKCSPAIENPKFFFSLRLSSKQLASDDWAMQLIHALDGSGIPGTCIEVDLIEHDDVSSCTPIGTYSMDIVHNAGIALTLNNFPGSPSSFLRLTHYKFDKIKINKLMIPASHESITAWARKRDVLVGLISIAISMRTAVVVDGIEKEEQFDFLGSLPISEWQGPYWGEPHTIGELLPRLQFLKR